MILDTREQYLKEYFFIRYPELQLATLPIGDSVMRSEHKVGPDVHDYERLKNELMRLSLWRLEHIEEHHHLFCCDTLKYEIEKAELKRIVGMCQRYRIFFHHANNPTALMEQIEDVKKNWYQANHAITHLKLPSVLACMLAQLKGVSEEKAIQWAFLLKQTPNNLIVPQLPFLNNIFGMKKDGGRKKIVDKVLDQLAGRIQ